VAKVDQAAFVARARVVFERVADGQAEPVRQAAELIAASLAAGGVVQAFGTGHSRSLAQELTGRAGGLLPVNMLAVKDLVMFGDTAAAEILDPLCERDPVLAGRILELAVVEPADVFVIASNSGGNGAIVEMALLARRAGHPVVAITSLEHSRRITSRHPSGQRLFELADVVLDNCGAYGDAAVPLPDGTAVGPTSTVAGALLVGMLVTEVCGRLLAAGQQPPVLVSNNVPEGDGHNAPLWPRYADRVRPVEP
jgi:uncharacterized phosphosugar-binding protein